MRTNCRTVFRLMPSCRAIALKDWPRARSSRACSQRLTRCARATSCRCRLAPAGWVAAHHNLLITGPTGAGKSFVACALTHAAVRRGHTALYVRTPRLLAELALSRGDGRYVRRLGQLARIGLLVLDDFLLTPPSVIEAKDLLEVIDDRSQVRSTLVVSQLPVEAWHPALAGGDPTLADAILDRLVQHAHRLPLTGASMRRRQPPPETDNPVA